MKIKICSGNSYMQLITKEDLRQRKRFTSEIEGLNGTCTLRSV